MTVRLLSSSLIQTVIVSGSSWTGCYSYVDGLLDFLAALRILSYYRVTTEPSVPEEL